MSYVEIDTERCKGCFLCTALCPLKILAPSNSFNSSGYKPVELTDKSKCTGCASCALTCPDIAITVYRTSKTNSEKTNG